MPFQSTKTYGHEEGLSCAFRQWRADHSHCQLLHGYALSFKFTFTAERLDERGWVMDFGGFKEFKQRLKHTFDHRIAVAGDDPQIDRFLELEKIGAAQLTIFPDGVGVEKFALAGFLMMHNFLDEKYDDHIRKQGLRVVSCECAEHGANSAIFCVE